MIKLQRASAGSGKTYTLAREYIEYLLTLRNPETGEVRLRTLPELEEAASHILAVTFTNKATAEMKQRIIDRLDDLANSPKPVGKIDYLDYFVKLLGTDVPTLRTRAGEALAILLNNYSDFQVSTIDSFFQTILRTFAYEIDLADNYELELDSKVVARAAVDSTLSDVNTASGRSVIHRCLTELMQQELKEQKDNWNFFHKSTLGQSAYKDFFSTVEHLSSEEFAKKRRSLDAYFEAHPVGGNEFETLRRYFVKPAEELFEEAKRLARLVLREIPRFREVQAHLPGRAAKITRGQALISLSSPALFKLPLKITNAFSSKVKKFDAEQEQFSQLVQQFYDAVHAWYDYRTSERYTLWCVYYDYLRFLPLLYLTATRSEELLRERNCVQLSDTNAILRRVIGDDDAPFIYERLGSRIDHYLIDEFQDTSPMQYENFRPLLDESISRDNRNLIIGDAKQSIYRFRDADPSLILERVPADYAGAIHLCGDSDAENANHRTRENIVRFNNSLFTLFADKFDRRRVEDHKESKIPLEESDYFSTLFAQVRQKPASDAGGYAEMRIIINKEEKKKRKQEDAGEEEAEEAARPEECEESVPQLIAGLRKRGYNYGDIAILVRTNKEGMEEVQNLMAYNREHPDEPIDFISEESLLIVNAASVQTILAVLNLIALGETALAAAMPQNQSEAARNRRLRIGLDLFTCHYQLLALRNPGKTPAELLEMFQQQTDFDLTPLFGSLRSMALPALVESIISKFFSAEIRTKEAPYIAAFQDLVLDFCEHNPSELSSFLKWWELRSPSAGIASPDGLDAVRIMTIHKAKGLEFQCVILPAITSRLDPVFPGLTWVAPDHDVLDLPEELRETLPDVVPIKLGKNLIGTPHEEIFLDELRSYRMDIINTWYVAFTRPISELYVYIELPASEKLPTIKGDLIEHLDSFSSPLLDGAEHSLDPTQLDCTNFNENSGGIIRVGTPLTEKEIFDMHEKQRLKNEAEAHEKATFHSYDSDIPPHNFLHFRTEQHSRYRDEDPDPRSEGNRLHDILSHVYRPEDLPTAVRRRVIAGLFSEKEGKRLLTILQEALARPSAAKWFRPGLKVINERSLLHTGSHITRPDRIIVDEQGNATVIDYKFGQTQKPGYRRQVASYVRRLRATGRFASVSGYLWYVRLDLIEPIE